jgi:EAL domain-containing protein (putative c-di-GMP-specific phosphodiesterase class I)
MDPTFAIAGNQFHITASIGITIYPNDSTHSTELLGYADQAMFVAKKSGGNCFRFFTPAMQQETEYHQRIKNDLYIALQEQQFEVHYQPVIDLKNGTIEKAEALLRWTHPQQGEIQPGQFIHIAEESGLIIAIGDWVVQQVARQLQQWIHRFRPDFIVAINKSPKQFRLDPQHIEKTGQILKDCSINGGNVIFEITEGILMEKEQLSTDQLLALRDMGIEIALDDFGTGYSSMSYLQRFDIDYLKIDRAFVSDLGQNGSNETLCEAIIAMAHKLGLKVIAEGIETRQQLELLLEMDCDYGQGFYFSRALPAAEFEAYVDDFNRKAENKARPCPP